MTPPLPKLPRKLKASGRPLSGAANGGYTVEQTKDGQKETVAGDERTKVIPAKGEAYIGQSIGFTLPGPKGSYMVARIDAHCYLPSGTTNEEIRATYQRCKDLISEQLEQDSKTVTQFFEEWQQDH